MSEEEEKSKANKRGVCTDEKEIRNSSNLVEKKASRISPAKHTSLGDGLC